VTAPEALQLHRRTEWYGTVYSGTYRDHKVETWKYTEANDWHIEMTPGGHGDGFRTRAKAINAAKRGIDHALDSKKT